MPKPRDVGIRQIQDCKKQIIRTKYPMQTQDNIYPPIEAEV